MKRYLDILKNTLLIVVVFIVVWGSGYYFRGIEDDKVITKVKENNTFDLELPGEVERRVITVSEIKSELAEIKELSTYSTQYTCTLGKDETRYLLEDIPVFGSKNSIQITCKGIVKVGYEIDNIVVKVNEDKIYISVPEASVTDNYVVWDSIECKETNNIFNPIEFEQYKEIIGEIKLMGLEDAISKGVYQKAEDNLKRLVEEFLDEFEGYEIIFME